MKWLLAIFLATVASIAVASVHEARSFTNNGEHKEALLALDKVKISDADYNEYCYLKAVNHFSMNQAEEASFWIEKLLSSFSEMPKRYHEVAILMKHDMETWTKNDLGDVSRKMKIASERLSKNKGGKETQEVQKDILDTLGKMIKEKEDALEAAMMQRLKEEEEARKRGEAAFRERSPDPQDDTLGGHENGTGKIDRKKVREIAELWGKLPEKERAVALRELTRTMPAKDRSVIEAYFKKLQEKK